MPAVVALCKMEMVSMKSGKAPRNLPIRSRAELSPSSFYTAGQMVEKCKNRKEVEERIRQKGNGRMEIGNVKMKQIQKEENGEHLPMAIEDDLFEVLKVGIVDEGAEVSPSWRWDCRQSLEK